MGTKSIRCNNTKKKKKKDPRYSYLHVSDFLLRLQKNLYGCTSQSKGLTSIGFVCLGPLGVYPGYTDGKI